MIRESAVDESRRRADSVCVRKLDSATRRLPPPWRTIGDILLVVLVSVGVVLTVDLEVAKPLSVTTSSMEPALHCARPVEGCEARFSDRVIVCEICYAFAAPERGEIVAFHAPAAASRICGEGGVYVKRLIGLPGETVHEDRQGSVSIDGHRLMSHTSRPRTDSAMTATVVRPGTCRRAPTSCSATTGATRVTRVCGETCRAPA